MLHIETRNGTVNIWLNFHDCEGRLVESISVISDADRFAGKPIVISDPAEIPGIRLIRQLKEES